MIKLVELSSLPAAELFCSYCQSLQLNVVYRQQSEHQIELWCPAGQLQQVEVLWQQFVLDPTDSKYQAAAWQQAQPARWQGQSGLSGYWQQLWAQGGWFTHLIWMLAIVVYGWQQVAPWQALEALQLRADLGLSLAQGWRWLTPAWLHFSAAHLVFNLMWVWYLLGPLEKRSGVLAAFTLVFTSILASHWLQFAIAGPNFGGLSGLVYGLFGFYWIAGLRQPQWGYQLSRSLIGFMLVWLVIGFADLLWIPMANWAHLGGLLAGMLMAFMLTLTGRR